MVKGAEASSIRNSQLQYSIQSFVTPVMPKWVCKTRRRFTTFTTVSSAQPNSVQRMQLSQLERHVKVPPDGWWGTTYVLKTSAYCVRKCDFEVLFNSIHSTVYCLSCRLHDCISAAAACRLQCGEAARYCRSLLCSRHWRQAKQQQCIHSTFMQPSCSIPPLIRDTEI